MAGVSIQVTINDAALRRRMKRIGLWHERAAKPIGMALVRGTRRRFMAGVDPDGARWAALKPAYAAIKRGGGILRASGLLMRSISAQTSADEVRVGTNLISARVHQFGATILPRRAPRLVFRLAGGLVKAKSVTIPARPFLGIDAQDEQEIADVLDAVIGR